MVAAIEQGFPQREIAESAYRFQQAVERRDQLIVGVNAYQDATDEPMSVLYIDDRAAATQQARLDEVRKRRNGARLDRALQELRLAARGGDNTIYPLLDCVRAYATVGEMCDALREVWGEWEEVPSI
jgi:methylmalonyl-CoA mutase N-terminal domain/subunit